MNEFEHTSVCSRTDHKEERVPLRNIRTGDIGFTFGCTSEGQTIQVELQSGELDSWVFSDCIEVK
jgi:hypothetical protein